MGPSLHITKTLPVQAICVVCWFVVKLSLVADERPSRLEGMIKVNKVAACGRFRVWLVWLDLTLCLRVCNFVSAA